MLSRIRSFTLTPRQYFLVALVALISLVAIILTGAAVRLTGSGLGCPDWPKCYGSAVPPLQSHALIEYANRLFTGLVGVAVIAASVLAWRRRPFRWHLALFGALLPVGVICQAILGGLVVQHHLAPGLVMSHFILSMLLLDAAFALAWCSRYEPGERRASEDRLGVWAVRGAHPPRPADDHRRHDHHRLGPARRRARPRARAALRPSRAPGRFAGWSSATPSSRASSPSARSRVYFLLRREGGDGRALRPLGFVIGLLALQGAVGGIQWWLKLPSELVWVHVGLATATWLATLWTVATAGRLAPAREPAATAAIEKQAGIA